MTNPAVIPEGPGAAVVQATRKTVMRACVVAGLLVLGFVGSNLLESSLHLTFDKPPMPLKKPLSELSKQLGGQYTAEGPDEVMDDETVDVLGTKDYLLRTYTDLMKHSGEVGTKLKLNLNYYSTGNANPHVPEICWAGAGMNEAASSRRSFDVANVRRQDGSTINLRMRMISFLPHQEFSSTGQSEKESSRLLNVAYVFEVNGNYVSTPQEVSSVFWVASSPHAYHTKIEVTVPDYCTQDEAIQVVSDFMRVAVPAVEECLPAHEGEGRSVGGSRRQRKQ